MSRSEHDSPAIGFDPFNDRPSRVVRNCLSEMLRQCLERREIFGADADRILARYPQAPYSDYIRDRRARYRAATREALSASASPVSWAVVLWHHGLYFEAHEVLEPHWRQATGGEREGLQGLIQAAGAFVHLEAGREIVAMRMAHKAMSRLESSGAALGDQHHHAVEFLMVQLNNLVASLTRCRK